MNRGFNIVERYVRERFLQVGIEIGGSSPHDIQVDDPRFYRRVLADGSLGLGESYVEGWWNCEDMVEMIACIGYHDLEQHVKASWKLLLGRIRARLFNLQSQKRSTIVGRDHYDLTLKAYEWMTDDWNTLSCGYWDSANTLDEAQEAKLDLVCRKLGISAQDRVLDIGCGFGSFARYASSKYGCAVAGINISPQQADQARTLCEGLPVQVHTCDYRDTETYLGNGKFKKAVSIGMFEHVGYKNYRRYFESVHECLEDDGIFLLHTIGSNVSLTANDPWFDKYIFPNGLVPSIAQIGEASEGLFVMEDWHNFGHDYSTTLQSWFENFDSAWTGTKDDPFYRMWTYYLLSSAGWFKSRRASLWQVVLSKGGVAGGYRSVR